VCCGPAACTPTKVLIEGSTGEDNATGQATAYQRSRQFKLRTLLFSQCGEGSLLLPTTAKWTAEPRQDVAGNTAELVTFSATSRELIVPSKKLKYGNYTVKVVLVSQCSASVTHL